MTIVTTTYGMLEGVTDKGINIFWGIPYAEPPVGELRFRAPLPPKAWSGTHIADRAGPASVQSEHVLPGFSAAGPKEEDCLYLNVFTPNADGKKRPVMLWIHGGGFTHGSGTDDIYDGIPLALRGDVVVVSINYRLGALGFLHLKSHLPDMDVDNNLGMLDCVAALQWTRDNIVRFGGDPDNITIFGESAGAFAVGTLLAMPPAKGLFHRAILQSGQGRAQHPDAAAATTIALLEDLEFTPDEASALLFIPAERILAAQSRIAGRGMRYSPVRDPDTLPEHPLMAIAAGAAEEIDLLIGHNRDENKLFQIAQGQRDPIDVKIAVKKIKHALPGFDDDALKTVIETYRSSRRDNKLSDAYLDVADAIIGDVMFRAGGIAVAEAQAARGAKAFMYMFTHESPARGGSLGACHALELPFVFGSHDQFTQQRFAGVGDKVKALSENMMDAWINFARTGDPSHAGIGRWSPYDTANRNTMIFGPETGAVDDPLPEERKILTH
jgi:para-nitrobenzyl esterase